MTISFADKVAVITGAGSGLGRIYALELARRGARVVVNDPGAGLDGLGQSTAAQAVVAEIVTAGGEAIAHAGSVTEYDQMEDLVATTCARWGRIDILINNAGILRDRTFAKMAPDDFADVVRVHLLGSANATRAVWERMCQQGYGRILMTTSAVGLGGNFGQANYSAAKMGIVGLARTLHLEGARFDVRVNALAPIAGTRMTEDIFPEEAFQAFDPAKVAPAALFLVSDDAPSGVIVGAGGGYFHSAYLTMNPGLILPEQDMSVEGFAAAWPRIADRRDDFVISNGMEQATRAIALLTKAAG